MPEALGFAPKPGCVSLENNLIKARLLCLLAGCSIAISSCISTLICRFWIGLALGYRQEIKLVSFLRLRNFLKTSQLNPNKFKKV